MITVAIGEVFFFVENGPLSSFTGGENGLPGVPGPTFNLGFATIHATSGWSMYGFLAVCYVVGIVIGRRIVASPVGLIWIAIRENPLRAAAVGHNVHAYKLLAFVIAAAYSGAAGGLLGVMQGYMPPDAFTFETSGQVIMMTVIGGLETLFGPLVGAAVWLYLRDFLQGGLGLGASWKLVLGLVFVLLVSFLRRGILGGVADLYARLARGGATAHKQPAAPDLSLDELSLSTNPAATRAPPLPSRPIPAYTGPILVTKGLTKRYAGLLANSDIDFSVEQGELRGIIGPNGAGKSTFFKMLTCEVHPTSGTITFEGQDITGREVTEVCQTGLTKSYQVNQLFNRLTARQNIVISALAEKRGPFRLDVLRDPAHIPGLADLVNHTLDLVELTSRADVPVSNLAYGEKRRLEIGLALATSPSLLLLDEPLAGMSPRERAETVKLLKSISRGRTTIIIDHDMDALFELVERVTVLQEGRILVEGTPDEIKANAIVREAYLGGILV
jgi:branched-chain amino acid transport system permease protein